MANKQVYYDDPTSITRMAVAMGENATPGAAAQYAKFNAYTSMLAFQAVYTITTAGTISGAVVVVNKISGTATTALATGTVGSSAIGSVVAVPLTTAAGGVSLIQGDLLTTLLSTDSSMKAAVTYELQTAYNANLIL